MKKLYRIITSTLVIGAVLSLVPSYGITSENETSINQGTSFQGHRDGTYGPEGAGGYGLPDMTKLKDKKQVQEKTTEQKPIFQNIRKGTSFQDHKDGKYGPAGAGGYGSPVLDNTGGSESESKPE